MITYSIIQKSQLENAKRMDAEYYQPEFLTMRNKLADYKAKKFLKNIATIKTGPAYSSEKIGENFEIPLARIGDVTNKNSIENWLTLSKDEFEKFKNNKINNNDILMTMTGDPPDVGKVNLIRNENNRALAFNQRVAKLHSKSKKISNKFLFAYLSTELSRFQAERAALGIRQRNLGIEDLRNILVIMPDNVGNIEKMVGDYFESLENSKNFYQQAENLLLEELGLKNFEIEESLSSVVKLSEIKNAHRMDAEYFQEKYKKLIEKIENYKNGFDVVKNIVSWKKGIEVGSEAYQDAGKDFIRVSDFSINGIEESNKKISERLFEEIKKDFQPKKGEVLFTKDGTIGMSHVLKDDIEGILSGAFLRLRLKEKYKNFEKECLTLIFNSILCKSQVEKLSGGAIIAHLKPSDFEKFKIPLIKPQIQKQIAELVQKSHKLRKKAKELLEEAKRKVEEMIENQN